MIEAPNGCSEVAGFSKPRSTETLSSVFSFFFFFLKVFLQKKKSIVFNWGLFSHLLWLKNRRQEEFVAILASYGSVIRCAVVDNV